MTVSKFTLKYFINQETGCWEWTAGKSSDGYAMMYLEGKMIYSHRWSYEYYNTAIPSKYIIDHLCRVRHCVNPNHLEAVTSKENTRRGDHSRMGWNNKEKTHCPNNHEYSKENTYIKNKKYRVCATCAKEQSKNYYNKKVNK
jgi:hypothetical protein